MLREMGGFNRCVRRKVFIFCDERDGRFREVLTRFNRSVRRKVFIFWVEKGWMVSRGFNRFQQECQTDDGFYFV